MNSPIRGTKDFWSGTIFIATGLAAVFFARDYSMGTAGRMGPAYFPTILGTMLAVLGVISVVRSMLRSDDGVSKFPVQEIALILAGVVLFGILARGAGLVVSVIVLVMVSGYASIKFKLAPYLILAVGLAVSCALVFVKGLGVPMPMFGPWLGF